MKRFLLKTEPSEYSFDNLVKEKKGIWSGVKNPAALIHLRSMTKGDKAFIYHTGSEKQVVGIAEIVSDPYPDPDGHDDKFVVVDLRPVQKLRVPVTLATIKSKKDFKKFPLVTISRLSVMPVTDEEWDTIISLST